MAIKVCYFTPSQVDIGKVIEVRQFDKGPWKKRKLLAVLQQPQISRFVCEDESSDEYSAIWKFARLAVEYNTDSGVVSHENIGQLVEVRDSDRCEWVSRELIDVLSPNQEFRYICRDAGASCCNASWLYARLPNCDT